MVISRLMVRQSAQVIRTRGRVQPVLLGTLAVLSLMAASAAAATYLVLMSVPAMEDAQIEAAEVAGFTAGRVTAFAEMSGAVAAAYEQGHIDAIAGRARRDAAAMHEVRP